MDKFKFLMKYFLYSVKTKKETTFFIVETILFVATAFASISGVISLISLLIVSTVPSWYLTSCVIIGVAFTYVFVYIVFYIMIFIKRGIHNSNLAYVQKHGKYCICTLPRIKNINKERDIRYINKCVEYVLIDYVMRDVRNISYGEYINKHNSTRYLSLYDAEVERDKMEKILKESNKPYQSSILDNIIFIEEIGSTK